MITVFERGERRMAGHSKWKNIQHRKGAQDAKKGKVFTKMIKELSVAVKTGGGPDPDSNPKLRTAIQNARGVNMPKDNIDRAIKKAAGMGSDEIIEASFECYGPDGVAIFVDCATDNKTRTVGNIRSYFNKMGGSIGKDGCLQFVFESKSIFQIPKNDLNEDDFTMDLIDAGADDVEVDGDSIVVTAAKENFGNIQKKLQEMSIEPSESGIQRIPTNMKKITDLKTLATFMKLIDTLEDDDDVLKVYHNLEYDEEMMNKL